MLYNYSSFILKVQIIHTCICDGNLIFIMHDIIRADCIIISWHFTFVHSKIFWAQHIFLSIENFNSAEFVSFTDPEMVALLSNNVFIQWGFWSWLMETIVWNDPLSFLCNSKEIIAIRLEGFVMEQMIRRSFSKYFTVGGTACICTCCDRAATKKIHVLHSMVTNTNICVFFCCWLFEKNNTAIAIAWLFF